MRALITPTLRRASLLTAGLLVFGLILTACGGGSSTTGAATPTATTAAATATTASASPTPSGSQASVKMTGSLASGFAFTPASITIKVGTTVVWTNATGTIHTSSSDAGSAVTWDSSIINPGGTFSFTFTQVGTFHYHCNIHPTMHGTIVVTS